MINKYNNTYSKDNNTDNIINDSLDNKVYENNKDIKDNKDNPNNSGEWVNLDPILMLKIRLKTNPVTILIMNHQNIYVIKIQIPKLIANLLPGMELSVL